MRFEFAHGETRPGEEERRREVIPHGVAKEIGEVKPVPRGRSVMACECGPRFEAFLYDEPVRPFNPNPSRRKYPPIIARFEMLNHGAGLCSVDPNGRLPVSRVALKLEKASIVIEGNGNRANATPLFEAAVSLDRGFK